MTTSPRRCYFSPSENTIYISQINLFYRTYPAAFIRRDRIAIPLCHVSHHTASLPPDSIPTDIQQSNTHYIITLHIPPRLREPIEIPPQLPPWMNIILRNTEIHDQALLKQVVEDINSDITIVSDGGVHHYQGNFGLVIAP
jgi:hypothetical protein